VTSSLPAVNKGQKADYIIHAALHSEKTSPCFGNSSRLDSIMLPTSEKIVWFYNFPHGRFANAVFQYMFSEYIKNSRPYQVVLGSSITNVDLNQGLWDLFNLPHVNKIFESVTISDQIHSIFLGENRNINPDKDIEIIDSYFSTYAGKKILAVDGFFQYDTNQIKQNKRYHKAFIEKLSQQNFETQFQREIQKFQADLARWSETYLIGIHVRRGDYVNLKDSHVYFPLNLESALTKIAKILKLNRIENWKIYVATDDLTFCETYFAEKNIAIETSKTVFSLKNENDALIADLAALAHSNLVIASNSSFSLLACMLNIRGTMFLRQENRDGEILPFDPWRGPVLYGL
jgi:hypothetical protein